VFSSSKCTRMTTPAFGHPSLFKEGNPFPMIRSRFYKPSPQKPDWYQLFRYSPRIFAINASTRFISCKISLLARLQERDLLPSIGKRHFRLGPC
jgi:hypothetical protein